MSLAKKVWWLLPRRFLALIEYVERKLQVRIVPAKPQVLLSNPQSELNLLELVIGHYRRTHPDVYFLQIGANDGIQRDPIYPLIEKHGLSGALVEPQPGAFQRLQANYERFAGRSFTFINAAIAEEDGVLPLYTVKGGTDCLLASFDRSHLLKHRRVIKNIESMIEEIPVRCVSFDTLFKEIGQRYVDFLQIDTEGFDVEILRMFDVAARKPAIIQFEHAHVDEKKKEECFAMLVEQGYRLSVGGWDILAYRSDDDPRC